MSRDDTTRPDRVNPYIADSERLDEALADLKPGPAGWTISEKIGPIRVGAKAAVLLARAEKSAFTKVRELIAEHSLVAHPDKILILPEYPVRAASLEDYHTHLSETTRAKLSESRILNSAKHPILIGLVGGNYILAPGESVPFAATDPAYHANVWRMWGCSDVQFLDEDGEPIAVELSIKYPAKYLHGTFSVDNPLCLANNHANRDGSLNEDQEPAHRRLSARDVEFTHFSMVAEPPDPRCVRVDLPDADCLALRGVFALREQHRRLRTQLAETGYVVLPPRFYGGVIPARTLFPATNTLTLQFVKNLLELTGDLATQGKIVGQLEEGTHPYEACASMLGEDTLYQNALLLLQLYRYSEFDYGA